jgi:predicted nucleic acid-binding protein
VRIFLDTNVLVSAYTARQGFCAELLELILTDPHCLLLTGEVNVSELRSVLRRHVVFFFARKKMAPDPDFPRSDGF